MKYQTKAESLLKSMFQRLAPIAAMVCCTLLFSCTYKKAGWLVKGQDGAIYRLEISAAAESYRLIEVDSSAIKLLIK